MELLLLLWHLFLATFKVGMVCGAAYLLWIIFKSIRNS